MAKKLEVNVGESLGLQENGRLSPAKEKEYAEIIGKQFLCSACSRVVEVNKKSFGEEVICPECGQQMAQNV